MIPQENDKSYRLTLEFEFRCQESEEHYWKAVIAFLVQRHLNMELTIPRCKLGKYFTTPVYQAVTRDSDSYLDSGCIKAPSISLGKPIEGPPLSLQAQGKTPTHCGYCGKPKESS